MRLVGQLLWRMTMKFRLSRKQTATTPNDDVKNVLHETKQRRLILDDVTMTER